MHKGVWTALILLAFLALGGLLILLFFAGRARRKKTVFPLPEPEIPGPKTELGWLVSLLRGYDLPTELPEDERAALTEARNRFRRGGALYVRMNLEETVNQLRELLELGPKRLIPKRLERFGELVTSERERWINERNRYIGYLMNKEQPTEEPDLTIWSMLREETGEELGGNGFVIRTNWASIEVAIGAIEELDRLALLMDRGDKSEEEVAYNIVKHFAS